MGFQRAKWHSGLTYQQTCECCKTVIQYTDYSLDFRPWYADGFVDCPKCQSHLRHNENYALPSEEEPVVAVIPDPVPDYVAVSGAITAATQAEFCVACGRKFGLGDCYCAKCGTKRG